MVCGIYVQFWPVVSDPVQPWPTAEALAQRWALAVTGMVYPRVQQVGRISLLPLSFFRRSLLPLTTESQAHLKLFTVPSPPPHMTPQPPTNSFTFQTLFVETLSPTHDACLFTDARLIKCCLLMRPQYCVWASGCVITAQPCMPAR